MKYNLRKAKDKDQKFLFKVSSLAMESVSTITNPKKSLNLDNDIEFKKYKKKFNINQIKIIQCEGKDIGRLRVVRSKEFIYIGGLQILPKFQGRGIGKAVMGDLIIESKQIKVPIKLEVHHVNNKAISFYTKMGFQVIDENKKQKIMVYKP